MKIKKKKTLKPLCKWSGGKRNEIPLFKKYYPKEFNKFIEPFAGGAAVFFDLNFAGTNVINDIHPDLINFYKQISLGHAKKIYDLVTSFGVGEMEYYIVRGGGKKLVKGEVPFNPQNDIERAAKFYYLRKTCFRGMLRYNEKGEFNIPWGRYKTVSFEELKNQEYSDLLSRTDIMIGDYVKVFEKYNSEENFCFIDQPYDSVFNDYGFDNFDRQKQIELSEIFKTTHNKCLMIVGGSDFIRELYDGYIKFEYPKNYAFKIHSGRVGDEINVNHLVITNYEITE
jgi:DNA adenine methylase